MVTLFVIFCSTLLFLTGTRNKVATVVIVYLTIYICTCIPLCHYHVTREIKCLFEFEL